jgi:hypothetical protein
MPTSLLSNGSFPGVGERGKAMECEADHLPLSSAQVKKGGAIPPIPHISMSLWHIAEFIKHKDNFTLLILRKYIVKFEHHVKKD